MNECGGSHPNYERDPEEPDLIRVYVGPRGNWNFVLTSDESVEREWNNSVRHLFTELPPGIAWYLVNNREFQGVHIIIVKELPTAPVTNF